MRMLLICMTILDRPSFWQMGSPALPHIRLKNAQSTKLTFERPSNHRIAFCMYVIWTGLACSHPIIDVRHFFPRVCSQCNFHAAARVAHGIECILQWLHYSSCFFTCLIWLHEWIVAQQVGLSCAEDGQAPSSLCKTVQKVAQSTTVVYCDTFCTFLLCHLAKLHDS